MLLIVGVIILIVKYFGSNVVMVLYNSGNAVEYSIETPVNKYESIRNIEELKYAMDRMQYNLQPEIMIISSKVELSKFSIEEYLKKNNNISTVSIAYTQNYLHIKPEYSLWYQISQLHKFEEVRKYVSDDAIELYEIAKDIIDEIIDDHMTDYEKEKAIHDYIVLNTEYGTRSGDSAYTIAGVLENQIAVCQGYAETFKMFMDLLNIESYLIIGVATEDHEWNIVKIDGFYYHVDVTWDDPTPDMKGEVSYLFFNLTDDMISKDHRWQDKNLPICDSIESNYYYKEKLWVNSVNELKHRVIKGYYEGQQEFEFYCNFDSNENLSNIIIDIITENGFYGSIKYTEKENYIKVILN